MWLDLRDSRELALRLVIRDISAQYRQTFFGILWAFLPPIATALVFIVLHSQQVIRMGKTDTPYPVFVLFGTVLWQIFVDSLNAPLKVVTASTSMLAKINFPREALILSAIGQTLFNAGIKLLILVFVFIIYNMPFHWLNLLTLPALLSLILMGTMFGLLITPVGVLYTDISQALTVVTGLWFFVTPVVYPPPVNFPFSLLAVLNPVSPILNGTRDLATRGTLNDPGLFFGITALSLLILTATWIIYRLAIPILIERMSS